METCSICGAERLRQGVLYPARVLCACETDYKCDCGKVAVVVEFQRPVKGREPVLPADSKFYCRSHSPLQEIVVVKKSKTRPRMDPVWERLVGTPPAEAASKEKVKCSACGHIHKVCDRVMWNGSHSTCPLKTCTERMFVPCWDEKEVNE